MGKGIHNVELNYHPHPDTTITKDKGWWIIDNQGVKIFLSLLSTSDFTPVIGQENTCLGWYSVAYGIKKEAGFLHCTTDGHVQDVKFVTAVFIRVPMEINCLQERAQSI